MIVVLFAFLVDLRASLIVSVLIPLSLLTAFIYLKLRGLSANLLSMGAVDFGIIVDGAVVIIEVITLHADPARGRPTPSRRRRGDDGAHPRRLRRGDPADGVRAPDHHRGLPCRSSSSSKVGAAS